MPHRDTDHVLSEIEETVSELQTRKQQDTQRRKQASITDHYGGPAERSDPGEFEGSLRLTIPHGAFGSERPLARRSDGEAPPLSSTGVELQTKSGQDPDRLEAATDYEVIVTISNDGTFSTPTAPLELFVSHQPPAATVDTADGTLELARSTGQTITGYTTLPPGDRIFGVGFKHEDDNDTLDSDSIRFVGQWSIADDRTFSVRGDLSSVTVDDYTLRLYDALDMPPQKRPQDTIVDAGAIGNDRLDQYENEILDGLTVLTEVDGVFTESPFNDTLDMDLPSTVGVATFVDHHEIEHHPRAESESTFTYTTPASRDTRVLTVVYARTYARSPEDLPTNMSALDHTRSRFVGRTERNWSR